MILDREMIIEKLDKITIPNYQGITIKEPKIIFCEEEKHANSNDEQDEIISIKIDDDYILDVDSIEKYLHDILSVNSDITIYKIIFLNHCYYSKLIIHSDKPLNVSYLNNKIKTCDSPEYNNLKIIIDNEQTIINNINNVLQNKQQCPEGAVPVSKLLEVFNNRMRIIGTLESGVEEELIKKVKNTLVYSKNFKNKDVIVSFEKNTKTLRIKIGDYWRGGEFYFKYDIDGIIVPKDHLNSDGINFFKEIKTEIAKYFKFNIENNSLLHSALSCHIPVMNADYIINLTSSSIKSVFSINKKPSYSDWSTNNLLLINYDAKELEKYHYDSSCNNIVQLLLLNDKLNDLYDNTFIKIEDCPEILREDLLSDLTNVEKIKQELTYNMLTKCSSSKSKLAKHTKSLILKMNRYK